MSYLLKSAFVIPLIASSFMCVSAALIGVISFLQKRSLIGEMASHCTYPGLLLGGIIGSVLSSDPFIGALIGAFISALIGIKLQGFLEKKKISQDAALTFLLSSLFGIGVLIASHAQMVEPLIYKQLQVYLFGQTSTMVEMHMWIYIALFAFSSLFLFSNFSTIRLMLFDPSFARSHIRYSMWDKFIHYLFILSIVVGIRSVGIVLMSGMLIAPSVFAKFYTKRLHHFFLLAALAGLFSAVVGNILSLELSLNYFVPIPSGPVIVCVGASLSLFALLFAKERGAVFRIIRMARFRYSSTKENMLKEMYKEARALSFSDLREKLHLKAPMLLFHLYFLQKGGLIKRSNKEYQLTMAGKNRGKQILRLHRLWELYLSEHMGISSEKVHKNAEEMEHIITPELEEKLTKLLANPTKDPHAKPIPGRYDEPILG